MTVHLEIPAFYIDNVLLDDLNLTGADLYVEIFNKNPEPEQHAVRVDSHISFDIGGSTAPTLAETLVSILITNQNGTQIEQAIVYDGGGTGFQSGYDGPDSTVTVIDASTTRFVIDRTTDFDPLSTVEIYVATTTLNLWTIKYVNWTFYTEDLVAPRLTSAVGYGDEIVRVTFDEPVVHTVASNSNSSLNPSNYSIERISVPSVDISVSSVSFVTTNIVDLTLNTEMTPGATYRLTVENVEDLFSNVITGPYDTYDFTGYLYEVDGERSFDLWEFISQTNRNSDAGDLYNFISCLQEVTNLLLHGIDRWTDILDPDIADEDYIDCMLSDLGNPFDFDIDLVDKRKLIRILIDVYRQKGTGVGIINVVRFFVGIEVTINAFNEEGWDLGIDELGDSSTEGTAILGPSSSFALYSFEIVSPIILTEDQRDQITIIAEYMKPAHTHLIEIVEPETPVVIDHIELGLSELGGEEWLLH